MQAVPVVKVKTSASSGLKTKPSSALGVVKTKPSSALGVVKTKPSSASAVKSSGKPRSMSAARHKTIPSVVAAKPSKAAPALVQCKPTNPVAALPVKSSLSKELNEENFKAQVSETTLSLVQFYVTWCPYCQQLQPEFRHAARKLEAKKSAISFGQVNCDLEKSLSRKYKIDIYPKIILFKNGHQHETYYGPRDYKSIETYLNKKHMEMINSA